MRYILTEIQNGRHLTVVHTTAVHNHTVSGKNHLRTLCAILFMNRQRDSGNHITCTSVVQLASLQIC